jgi:ribosomal protein S18 acetylase RimI-like enzyme
MQSFLDIRGIKVADYDGITAIETQSMGAEQAFTRKQIAAALRKTNCFGKVALGPEMLGYVIYEIKDDSLAIVRLAVHPAVRKQGIATALLNQLIIEKPRKVKTFHITVPERALACQLFLRGLGFVCVASLGTEYYFELGDA